MYVKICGVTRRQDAEACVLAGADALGINLVPGSPRCVEPALARELCQALRGRVELVLVIANRDESQLRSLHQYTRCDRLQLHGNEGHAQVKAWVPVAFKAVRLGSEADLERTHYECEPLLVDALHGDKLGGTGRRVDVALVEPVARRRAVLLAGGLTPENVAEAIAAVRPWGVDTASGVESAPGIKDHARVLAFVAAARAAFASFPSEHHVDGTLGSTGC